MRRAYRASRYTSRRQSSVLTVEQEPATAECNEHLWLEDKWLLQEVLANIEKIKRPGEDSDTYKRCFRCEQRYRSLLESLP
ncbi:uncharacterized protein ARMOST_01196 [Armillaria ostoyae]|uniref:Uncharacterized protein n=1 Tax=Armillaria ostoyae TaxID=47428 RepID=A0A284QNE2_ARMOS|nr:uncharacterized protein ARMOST_01196 [Armillaria ostoyae]